MAKKKTDKVDVKSAWLIIGLTVVLAVLVVAALALRGLPGEEKHPETTGASAPTEQTTAPTGETTAPVETVPQGTVTIVDQIDGSYEQWLSAALVMVLPLEYPDFSDLEIYAPGTTDLAKKQESQGIYLKFTSGGAKVILHAAPLEAERTQAGTRDVNSMQIGFATMDAVSGEGLDFSAMERLLLEDLGEHIAQTMLPAVYQR